MAFTHRPLNAGIGAEVLGLRIDGPIAEKTAQDLKTLWLDVGIVLFRGVGTSPEALIELSKCFGELEQHPLEKFRMPGYPDLILLTNQNGPVGPVYEYDGVSTYGRIPWHTDLAFTTTPNAGALLRMVQKTATGGQTGWVDTAAAYDDLGPETKYRIQHLEACYHFTTDLADMRFNNPGGKRVVTRRTDYPSYPPVAHPLVWTHPDTGRKILNVSTLNIQSILGLPGVESDALIQQLIDHTLQPKYQYIHNWENNDIMLWDNRRTMHSASGHPMDQIRIVQRSTIRGSVSMGRII
ncbi:MAG: TauD/TfdA family dioxygenase [Proteobacteria bacterium]|nr:TauD/TfdA family dioxygenase [Pseudomonadota bacterium]HQR03642.1 TauD/TfdA family dioxygenase [Rhodocyclaceae bacterium]